MDYSVAEAGLVQTGFIPYENFGLKERIRLKGRNYKKRGTQSIANKEEEREKEKEDKAMVNTAMVSVLLVVVGTLKLVLHVHRKRKMQRLVPHVTFCSEGAHLKHVERFGDYVVRQIGLCRETAAAKNLAKVAEDYLRGDKSSSDHSRENVCILVSAASDHKTDDELAHLHNELLLELDACMVAYVSFHWKHASALVEQVISNGANQKQLRRLVLLATRKQRLQRIFKHLKTKRKFATLVEQLKAIRSSDSSAPKEAHIVVPADSSVRSPVLLLIGGGMGAGKSTVVKDILKSSFWSGVAHKAVVVEADAFKETDVIYRALSAMDHEDMAGTAELVHQSSMDAASSLLVAALNEGRDVIFDGTMSWEPFVLQTIAMARDIHRRRYRMGPGYREGEVEEYWEPVPNGQDATNNETKASVIRLNGNTSSALNGTKLTEAVSEGAHHEIGERRPYRIEFVGVTCDAHLAVVRGVRRAILTRRGVPVPGQLRSHKLFAKSLDNYIERVDHVKLYCTSQMYGPAELIGVKEGPDKKLLVDIDTMEGVRHLAKLNTEAGSVLELYGETLSTGFSNHTWHNLVLAVEREKRQALLRAALDTHASDALLQEMSDSDTSLQGEESVDAYSPSSSSLSFSRLLKSDGGESSEEYLGLS